MSLSLAISKADPSELPSRRDEDWRWTDLRGLIREVPAPARPGHVWGPGLFEHVPADSRSEIVNGQEAKPVTLMVDGETHQARFVTDGAGSSTSRLQVAVVGENCVLLETYENAEGGALAFVQLEIEIAPEASLERIVICESAADAVLVSQARVTLGAGASFKQTVLTSGARRQRLETRVEHPGQGASARLDGLYVNALQAHSDITTVVTHEGVGGETSQLIKGVVTDQARGVFQGRIVVSPGADKTDARMGHHALILSERAEVDAKPELEIYADDVACAHGNTVGALDEDALFYARQRGIPEPEARALLTEAFLGEVIDRIEHEGAREVCSAWLAERLRGGEA
ncbi:MAG: Fe-S cluster assembly protein SufD [Caulobacteraceae bacterium]